MIEGLATDFQLEIDEEGNVIDDYFDEEFFNDDIDMLEQNLFLKKSAMEEDE